MTTEIHLTDDDIKEIIANKFGVRLGDVDLICYTKTVGYYKGEHYEYSVKAVIKANETANTL